MPYFSGAIIQLLFGTKLMEVKSNKGALPISSGRRKRIMPYAAVKHEARGSSRDKLKWQLHRRKSLRVEWVIGK
jgi:hypothetical protein